MHIKKFTFNPFYENTYVIHDANKKACVIDPGCYEDYEKDEIDEYIESNGLEVTLVLNTHCHIDHVLGNHYLKNKYKAPLWIPQDEAALLEGMIDYSKNWGITNYQAADPDKLIALDPIVIGDLLFETRLVPGHSPGHLVFYNEKEKVLFGGDVIFRDSIGRTDLPGGDHDQLLQNIKEQVFTLPDDVVVYPGHGPSTTVAYEKLNNPFLKHLI